MQTFKSPFGNLIPFPTTSAEMDEYERMRRDYRPTHASQQSSNLPNVQGLNYGSYMQGQSNVDSSNYAGAHDPEGAPNVYSRGGYRDAYNNALNDAMNVHGGLRNAQRESDVNNANRALDKWRTDIANEKKAKEDKAKKIAELQKWLAEHKDEYLTAKKWIARYNDPVFQGLNRKGIDSGDFSGLANYVQQQDDKEAEKKRKKSDMNTVIKHYNDANYRLKVAENAPDANRDITREDLKFVNEVIGELEDAEQTDLAQQLRERLEGVEKLVLAGKQGEANEEAKKRATTNVSNAFTSVMQTIIGNQRTTYQQKLEEADKWLKENIGVGDIEAVKKGNSQYQKLVKSAKSEATGYTGRTPTTKPPKK